MVTLRVLLIHSTMPAQWCPSLISWLSEVMLLLTSNISLAIITTWRHLLRRPVSRPLNRVQLRRWQWTYPVVDKWTLLTRSVRINPLVKTSAPVLAIVGRTFAPTRHLSSNISVSLVLNNEVNSDLSL